MNSLTTTQHNASLLIERGARGSDNSQKQFNSNIKLFLEWLDHRDLSVQTVCLYLSKLHLDGKKQSTILVAKSNIGKYCELKHLDNLTKSAEVKSLTKGLGYEMAGQKQKQALSLSSFDEVRIKLKAIENDQHRFMFSMLFHSACRMNEIRVLRANDLKLIDDNLIVYINKSKTDQMGNGYKKYIPKLQESNVSICCFTMTTKLFETNDYLFATKNGKPFAKSYFAKLFKLYFGIQYSTHSARATFVTCAIKNGASAEAVMKQTKHKSAEMVNRYNRDTDVTKNNAVNLLV